jgi:hypothetical protein
MLVSKQSSAAVLNQVKLHHNQMVHKTSSPIIHINNNSPSQEIKDLSNSTKELSNSLEKDHSNLFEKKLEYDSDNGKESEVKKEKITTDHSSKNNIESNTTKISIILLYIY